MENEEGEVVRICAQDVGTTDHCLVWKESHYRRHHPADLLSNPSTKIVTRGTEDGKSLTIQFQGG